MMSSDNHKATLWPTMLLFVVAMVVWGIFSHGQQLNFKESIAEADKNNLRRHLQDERLTFEVFSSDLPTRAIVEVGFDRKVRWANQFAESHWGLTEGINLNQIIPDVFRAEHNQLVDAGIVDAEKRAAEADLSQSWNVQIVNVTECDAVAKNGDIEKVSVRIFSTNRHFVVFIDKLEG